MAINFKDLASKAKQVASGSGKKYGDDRIWYPKRNESGNGSAVIRFLPGKDGNESDEMPWVQIWHHAFKGPGGWYIENSLTTKELPDPCGEANGVLWNSGIDSNKEIARARKRKLSYYSNILVIKDEATPENEGKIFLYKYGKKIFDKLNEVMDPEFEDEKVINPFNLSGEETETSPPGANFKLKIRQVEGYANYDKSEFSSPTDSDIGDKVKGCYDLQELIADDKFKPYNDLKRRFDQVTGVTADMKKTMENEKEEASDLPMSQPPASNVDNIDNDDDSEIERFKRLANNNLSDSED